MKSTDESTTQTPWTKVNFDLAELLAQVTEENIHVEVDTGVVIGLEMW